MEQTSSSIGMIYCLSCDCVHHKAKAMVFASGFRTVDNTILHVGVCDNGSDPGTRMVGKFGLEGESPNRGDFYLS